MRTSLLCYAALASALSVHAAAQAQAMPDSQSIVSVTTEQIYVANTTDQEIVFIVESENTQRTEYRLAPGAAGTLHGEPGDKWLNIEMQPGRSPAGAIGTATQ